MATSLAHCGTGEAVLGFNAAVAAPFQECPVQYVLLQTRVIDARKNQAGQVHLETHHTRTSLSTGCRDIYVEHHICINTRFQLPRQTALAFHSTNSSNQSRNGTKNRKFQCVKTYKHSWHYPNAIHPYHANPLIMIPSR